MNLMCWSQHDIQNTLLALNQTQLDTTRPLLGLAGETAELRAYRAGYSDALRAMAVAFGLVHSGQGTSCAQHAPQITKIKIKAQLPQTWETLLGSLVATEGSEEL